MNSPQTFSAAATSGPASAEPKVLEEKRYTILLVDDSETDRLIYRRYARSTGLAKFSFIEAECGETGLELCRQYSPDLILLDYMLPDVDGLEFLQTLQEKMSPVPPAIMLTGEGNEKVAVDAMKMGVRDYLVKGDFTADKLSQAILRVLSQQALQQLVDRQERQQKLLAAVAVRINRAENIVETFQTITDGARELLECDRTLIYRLEPDMSGSVMAESVLPGLTANFGARSEQETCLHVKGIKEAAGCCPHRSQGHSMAVSDIYNADLVPCYADMLEHFRVKANLVVPVFIGEPTTDNPQQGPVPTEAVSQKLWGLLIAHHCSAPRDWQPDEMNLLDNLAVQLAIAVRQSELVAGLQSKAQALAASNAQLSDTAQQLKERNQELDEFSYVVSHDLRAPLRAISNLASWLEEDLFGEISTENMEQLTLLQSRTKRLDDFIIGLLEYSRAGRTNIKRTRVNTQSLLTEVIESLSIPSSFKIIKPNNMPVLRTQVLGLQQVFANLIGNAVKYHHRADGCITITVEEQGNKVKFSVADDGPGIPAEFHQKIFEVFQTLASRDEVEGTGIGLSIVKKVIERQGGKVSVHSVLNEGSTFSFTWPNTR